uniref:Uncharacterized protein n=1 Tax=Meloidogyne enterolobii TaxID=390850 RepID=A0A6V7XRZ9_MELEN|nr:unnamed protein product [Meloidogyne enterolobii]
MCSKPFNSSNAQKYHVCKEHGRYVWDFIIKNKRMKKANNYGVIGIREDGTPYAMPDGAGSTNAEHDADVGQPTLPEGSQQHVGLPPYHYGEQQHFTQIETNIENQEQHFGHTQPHFKLFGKDIYVGDQDATFPEYLYPSTEEEEQQMLLRAQEESARNAPFRSGNLAIGEGRSRQRGGASRRGSSRPEGILLTKK